MRELRVCSVALCAVLVPIVLTCVSATNVPKELGTTIPNGASAIKLYSFATPTDFYRIVYRAVAAEGYAIDQENQDMGTFATSYKDVGQYTTLRMNVFVEQSDNGSVATMRGQWAVTSSYGTAAGGAGATADEAVWGGTGRKSVAFGEMAVIATKIEHLRLEYVVK